MASASNKQNTRGKPTTKPPSPPPKKGAEKIGEKLAPSTVDAIKKRRALLDEI